MGICSPSPGSCRVKNSGLGGIQDSHGEGLSVRLKEILANYLVLGKGDDVYSVYGAGELLT